MRGNIALALVAVFIFVVIGFAIGVAYTDSSSEYSGEKQDASYTLYYSNGKQKTETQDSKYPQTQDSETDGKYSTVSQSTTVNYYTTYHTPAFYYPYPKYYYFSPYPYYPFYPKPIPKYPKPPHIPPRYPYWYGIKYYALS